MVNNETTSDLKQCGVDTIPFAEEKCNVEACTAETSTEPPKEELIEVCEEVETDDYEDEEISGEGETSGSGDGEMPPKVDGEALTEEGSGPDAESSLTPPMVEGSSTGSSGEGSADAPEEGSGASPMEGSGESVRDTFPCNSTCHLNCLFFLCSLV